MNDPERADDAAGPERSLYKNPGWREDAREEAPADEKPDAAAGTNSPAWFPAQAQALPAPTGAPETGERTEEAAEHLWNNAARILDDGGIQEAEATLRMLREVSEATGRMLEECRQIQEGPEEGEPLGAVSLEMAVRYGPSTCRALERRRAWLRERRRQIEQACLYYFRHGFPTEVPTWEELPGPEQQAILEEKAHQAAYSDEGREWFSAVSKAIGKTYYPSGDGKKKVSSVTAYSRLLARYNENAQDATAALNWFKNNGWAWKGITLEDLRDTLEEQARLMRKEKVI